VVSEPELAPLLRRHASEHSVPGAALGILKGDAVSTAACGVASTATGQPVTPDTRFAVGSLAKPMVATAIARLAEAGRLSLDDPASAHIPELRGTDWGERDTLRDLLANRSRCPLRAELEFGNFPGDDDGVLARFATKVASEVPSGSSWSYTNAGWCLLGRVLETVTGLVWEEAMRTCLLDPLRLEQTTFVAAPVAEPRASGHEATPEGLARAEPWAPRALGPAGSTLLSTIADLVRFARVQLEDPALAVLRAPAAEIRIHAWFDAWCLGWARFDWEGGPVWGWDGLLPGQRAVLRLVPDEHGAVILLTNSSTGRLLYRSLLPDLMDAEFGIRVPPLSLETSSDAARDLSRFAGVYAWPDRSIEVSARNATLSIESTSGVTEALPLDDRTFLIDRDDPDVPTMTFGAFDEQGRPGALYEMLWAFPRAQ
jgi:CubicO group peptidase (beta-lactamase class C family)